MSCPCTSSSTLTLSPPLSVLATKCVVNEEQRRDTDECREELVGRVWELVSAERRRLERQRYEEEREAQLSAQATATAQAQAQGQGQTQAQSSQHTNGDAPSTKADAGTSAADGENEGTAAGEADDIATPNTKSSTSTPPVAASDMDYKPAPTGPMPEIERGLCVVCQDEEATLAVVDCGHLCMCSRTSFLTACSSPLRSRCYTYTSIEVPAPFSVVSEPRQGRTGDNYYSIRLIT